MKQIISASRRTDMPAFYLDRLIECIKRREAIVPNPYSGRESRIDLSPDAVHTLVLWSKNFAPFLKQAEHFKDYRLYFLFTINNMPTFEAAIPPLDERLNQLTELARRYGPERIDWRFDPVLFTENGPAMEIDDFKRIAEHVVKCGVRRVIFSFLDIYGKVRARNNSMNLGIVDPPHEVKTAYAVKLSQAAQELGLSLMSCSEESLSVEGINPSSCIDGRLLSELAGETASKAKDTGQRKACKCTLSRDIGSYSQMPCPHGCLYCYANPVIEK